VGELLGVVVGVGQDKRGGRQDDELVVAAAVADANSRPSSESPAWRMTGRPCGLRGTLNCPEMSKKSSCRSNRPTSLRPTNSPVAASATTSRVVQESKSSHVVRMNRSARA
jgi:hypothetical protein